MHLEMFTVANSVEVSEGLLSMSGAGWEWHPSTDGNDLQVAIGLIVRLEQDDPDHLELVLGIERNGEPGTLGTLRVDAPNVRGGVIRKYCTQINLDLESPDPLSVVKFTITGEGMSGSTAFEMLAPIPDDLSNLSE